MECKAQPPTMSVVPRNPYSFSSKCISCADESVIRRKSVSHYLSVNLDLLQLTCGTNTIPSAVPAMEKPTACPRFLSKNVFNATKDEAIARPVPRPVGEDK